MPRPPGRLVAASLSESEKLSLCSERAALIYCLTLVQHDGEGRLQVDDVSMLDMLGRFAITHGWHVREMPALREEIGTSGLWRLYETKCGKTCAEVTDWQKHQRIDKIKRGSSLMDEAGGICGTDTGDGYAGGIPRPREGKGREEKLSEEKREPTRARISEENAGNGRERAPTSSLSSNRNTALYQKDAVLAAMARALGKEEFVESNVDEKARIRFSGPIERCPDFDAFLAWAIPPLREKKPVREHWLADVLPLLNDYKPGRATATAGIEPATGPPAWIDEARAKGWS